MTRIFMVCGLALFLWAGNAQAKSIDTGNDLLETCESKKNEQQLACINYITGVIDGIAFQTGFVIGILSVATQSRLAKYPGILKHYCIPHGVTFGQLRLILTKYLLNHPVDLHIIPPILIRDALVQAYPCK